MSEKLRIAVLPGDGIGPEVMEQALKVLSATAEKFNLSFDFKQCFVGGKAIDECGCPLPDETLKACEEALQLLHPWRCCLSQKYRLPDFPLY